MVVQLDFIKLIAILRVFSFRLLHLLKQCFFLLGDLLALLGIISHDLRQRTTEIRINNDFFVQFFLDFEPFL